VIIPALNEVDNIRQTIAAARRDYTPDAVEIILVDGGSTDGTPASHSDILIFCHADSQLPAGWREPKKPGF